MSEDNLYEPTAEAALDALFEMSRYASPADCGMDQGHAEQAKSVLSNVIKTLKLTATTFRGYEGLHLMKIPPDKEKAERNKDLADACELALQGKFAD